MQNRSYRRGKAPYSTRNSLGTLEDHGQSEVSNLGVSDMTEEMQTVAGEDRSEHNPPTGLSWIALF